MPRKTSADPSNPLESQEQAALVEWLTLKGWLFTATAQATPAGRMTAAGWKTAFGTLRKNRAIGVRKGFPDLCVVTGSGIVVFLEMKRRDGVPSDVSREQQEWIDALNADGIPTAVACGFLEAVACLEAVEAGRYWEGRISHYDHTKSRHA